MVTLSTTHAGVLSSSWSSSETEGYLSAKGIVTHNSQGTNPHETHDNLVSGVLTKRAHTQVCVWRGRCCNDLNSMNQPEQHQHGHLSRMDQCMPGRKNAVHNSDDLHYLTIELNCFKQRAVCTPPRAFSVASEAINMNRTEPFTSVGEYKHLSRHACMVTYKQRAH